VTPAQDVPAAAHCSVHASKLLFISEIGLPGKYRSSKPSLQRTRNSEPSSWAVYVDLSTATQLALGVLALEVVLELEATLEELEAMLALETLLVLIGKRLA
jgi:hypothetical protein